MPRTASEIVRAIQGFQPVNGNWLELDGLLEELFQGGFASQGIDAMLSVFERYPIDDGAGVFWAIVHGLESTPGYESGLVESVRRAPAEFSLLMVNRLLNAGVKEAGGVQLTSLVREVAERHGAVPEVRRVAQGILEDHAG